MIRWWRHSIIAIFALLLTGAGPGPQDEISKRQAELENLRQQIHDFEEKIREQQQQEMATLDLLDTYDRKATAVRTLISRLKRQEGEIQKKITASRKEIANLGDQLTFLKSHYARYIRSVYKSGRIRDVEVLLTSSSISQMYARIEYLKRFSEQRRTDAVRISTKKNDIEERQAKLQVQLAEERRLIAEKGTEEDRLASLSSDRQDVLNQIRKDKRTTQREIERKTKAAKEMEGLIANLIEADRIRKEKQETEMRSGKLPQPAPTVQGHFEEMRGKLRWPVGEGTVVARFGNQVHPTLRTVTTNTGIDIAVKSGSPVTAVADGEVSTITWLPSYGNVVIVNHYNGYRTVLTHLGEIDVVEGQQVHEGDMLGESGESLEGPRLHFEVWKDREKQNPQDWLAPQ